MVIYEVFCEILVLKSTVIVLELTKKFKSNLCDNMATHLLRNFLHVEHLEILLIVLL